MHCKGVIRLQHLNTRAFLHSHHFSSPLSGNQEVSAFGDSDSGDNGQFSCMVTMVSFTLLRSHVKSWQHALVGETRNVPVVYCTGKDAVSCFAFGMSVGDNWVVECNEDTWRRDDAIRLRHKDTNMYVRWQALFHMLAMNGPFETPRQGLLNVYMWNCY